MNSGSVNDEIRMADDESELETTNHPPPNSNYQLQITNDQLGVGTQLGIDKCFKQITNEDL